MKVVVTGSLGHIGRPLTAELIKNGHQPIVISSSPEKQKDIEALGARAAIGSLEDPGFLTSTCKDADALFAMIPPNYTDPDQTGYYKRIAGNYADAIRQSGIRQLIHLSSYGAHLDKGTGFILGSHHAENILNTLPGISISHLRAGYFYYNLLGFIGMIKGSGLIGANYGGNDRLLLVAPEDIAAAAADEFENPAPGTKLRYVLSDIHTASETAGILGAAIGKPDLQWLTFTDRQMQTGLEHNGVPAYTAALLTELGSCIHSGALYGSDLPEKMGKIKLEDFAKQFAAAF